MNTIIYIKSKVGPSVRDLSQIRCGQIRYSLVGQVGQVGQDGRISWSDQLISQVW